LKKIKKQFITNGAINEIEFENGLLEAYRELIKHDLYIKKQQAVTRINDYDKSKANKRPSVFISNLDESHFFDQSYNKQTDNAANNSLIRSMTM
jgi:hypothetical protein